MQTVGGGPGNSVHGWLCRLMLLVAVGGFSPKAIPAEAPGSNSRAIELYDAGDYAGARILLDQRVAGGQADGPTLYRLYYCQREAGDSVARETLLLARTALQAELPSAEGLETFFYLANVHRNTARLSEAKRVAKQATDDVENGKLAKPKDGTGMFQLGKLYADQERPDEAGRWYSKSIKAFAGAGKTLPPSAQWAARYLGEQAYEDRDWVGVDENLGALLKAGTGTVKDYDQLAISRVRSGDYEGAGTAWRRAGILNPVEGDHPRYCARLAKQAHELGSLPAKSPDDRAWEDLEPADLETLMSERAAAARATLAAAPPREAIQDKAARQLDDKLAAEFNDGIAKDRVVFVRAALEYAMRGLPIRETAFRAGYAPMIFHARQWKLPPRPRNTP